MNNDYNLEIKCHGCGNFIRVTSSWVKQLDFQKYTCSKCGRIYTLETFNPGEKPSVEWKFKIPFIQIIIQKIKKQENVE